MSGFDTFQVNVLTQAIEITNASHIYSTAFGLSVWLDRASEIYLSNWASPLGQWPESKASSISDEEHFEKIQSISKSQFIRRETGIREIEDHL